MNNESFSLRFLSLFLSLSLSSFLRIFFGWNQLEKRWRCNKKLGNFRVQKKFWFSNIFFSLLYRSPCTQLVPDHFVIFRSDRVVEFRISSPSPFPDSQSPFLLLLHRRVWLIHHLIEKKQREIRKQQAIGFPRLGARLYFSFLPKNYLKKTSSQVPRSSTGLIKLLNRFQSVFFHNSQ